MSRAFFYHFVQQVDPCQCVPGPVFVHSHRHLFSYGEQEFQVISGELLSNGSRIAIKGRMNGDKIDFSAGDYQYSGIVKGDAISGLAKSPNGGKEWTARRLPDA